MRKVHPVAVLLIVVIAITIAGCGGSADGDDGPGAVISVSKAVGIGPLLVNGRQITLYEFRKDKGTESECYGGCAKDCPPLLTEGEPRATDGAIAAKLGTTERRDGTTQVTYDGHPLYTWSGEEPGQARGRSVEAFEGKWYPLRPSGKAVIGI